VHAALKRPAERDPAVLLALLAEQRRTNRLLQGLVWGALGFLLGMVIARAWLTP
jgi:ubiquinone biosynthesis protein